MPDHRGKRKKRHLSKVRKARQKKKRVRGVKKKVQALTCRKDWENAESQRNSLGLKTKPCFGENDR